MSLSSARAERQIWGDREHGDNSIWSYREDRRGQKIGYDGDAEME